MFFVAKAPLPCEDTSFLFVFLTLDFHWRRQEELNLFGIFSNRATSQLLYL